MPTQLVVTPALPEEYTLLDRLVQFYLYDISVCAGADLDSAGVFADPALESFWATNGHTALLLRLGLTIVGFAFVGNSSQVQTAFGGHCCDALFVLRRYRRRGLGQAAAHTIFTDFPGEWEIAAPANNPPAQSFWRAVIDRFTQGQYSERWLQTATFRGNIQSFVATGATIRGGALPLNGTH